jgi:hypothetical protein
LSSVGIVLGFGWTHFIHQSLLLNLFYSLCGSRGLSTLLSGRVAVAIVVAGVSAFSAATATSDRDIARR